MDISAYQNMRISTRGKRPLRNLTPGDKVRAIQRIHNGETKASVSRDIGVPESTLRGWCKNEQKLRFMCRQLGAAINEPGLPLTNLDNPPEKRAKLIDSFDYSHAYGLNRLGVMSSGPGGGGGGSGGGRSNSNNTKTENKNNNFISNNVINDFMKKNGFGFETTKQQPPSDNGFLQNLSGLPTTSNFPQLPFVQNAHLLSFLNPANLAAQQLNAGNNKIDVNCGTKVPLRSSNASIELKEKINSNNNNNKKQISSLMVKNWANDSLLIPSVNSLKNSSNINNFNINNNINFHDKNDTNNNDVRPATISSPMHNTDFNEFPTLFPLGLPLPTSTPTALNVDNEIRNNAILQWTKVFNASLNFLALAAAAAAVQPNLNDTDRHSSANSESSESVYRNNDEYEIGSTRPLASIEHSEDSNFESEPEDLSIRSGTSKLSSPPQTPIQDIMSDSSTLSDNEH